MSYNTTADVVRFTVNSNTYNFLASEFVPFGFDRTEVNQVVQEMEGGQVKILQLDSKDRVFYTFQIRRMRKATRTEFGVSISGLTDLETMIKTDANYRQNTIEAWFRGESKGAPGSGTDVRYWSSSFSMEIALLVRTGISSFDEYYGTGSETITFRKEIT